MSEVLETFTLATSEDFEADLACLVMFLGCFEWSACGLSICAVKDKKGLQLKIDDYSREGEIIAPTVFPKIPKGDSFETIHLSDLAKALAAGIKQGQLEIRCYGEREDQSIYFEHLRVEADGSAERYRRIYKNKRTYQTFTENVGAPDES